jgi:hypothetical protein
MPTDADVTLDGHGIASGPTPIGSGYGVARLSLSGGPHSLTSTKNVGKGLWGIGPGMAHMGQAFGQDIYGFEENIRNMRTQSHQEAAARMGHVKKTVVDPMIQGYKYKYVDPFLRPDPRLLATRALYEDPVGTAFDIGSLATGAVGAGVRLGKIPAAAESITLRSPGMASIEKGIGGRAQFGRHSRILTDKAIKAMDARRRQQEEGLSP